MNIRDIFFFDSMITPRIITFIYWLLLVGVAIGGLVTIVGSFGVMRYSFAAGFGSFVGGVLMIPLGALVARVYCELMIVLFKINEALQDMRQNK